MASETAVKAANSVRGYPPLATETELADEIDAHFSPVLATKDAEIERLRFIVRERTHRVNGCICEECVETEYDIARVVERIRSERDALAVQVAELNRRWDHVVNGMSTDDVAAAHFAGRLTEIAEAAIQEPSRE